MSHFDTYVHLYSHALAAIIAKYGVIDTDARRKITESTKRIADAAFVQLTGAEPPVFKE